MTMRPTRRDLFCIAAGAAAGGLAVAAAERWLPRGSTAQPLPLERAEPAALGLDPARLQAAYALLESWTSGANPPVPGGAILVGRHGKVCAPRFFGRMGPEADAEPMRPDAMFLMASITKPVVYLAGLMLVERGLLDLAEPVVRHVPEFAGEGKEAVRVHHLFTHTSGLPDMLANNEALRRSHAPLERFLAGAVRDTTLAFPPGTQVSYQSMGTAVVAEIVQRLSGRSIATFLREEIFQPLGMTSTTLGAAGSDRSRLVRVEVPEYQAGSDFGWNSTYWQDLGAPWGGLFSTPEDFAVLCQVMLAGGAWGGVRLLSPATVARMTTNRLHDYPDLPEPIRRTQPWGLGWRLNHPAGSGSWGDLLGENVFGHTGATGTMVWMDPDRDGFCILLTSALRSRAPWRLNRLSNMVAAAFL